MGGNIFLKELEEQLDKYNDELKKVTKQKQSLDQKIGQLERCIERVRLLHEAERERIGERILAIPTISISEYKFRSMPLSKALKILLRKNLRMNLEQLEEHLRQGGFQFDAKKKPRRQIHFTLIKVRWAKRREDGVWEWRGGRTIRIT